MRMLGLVVLVPLIEELFWRSFLIRWLIDPDFHQVPIGRVTLLAGRRDVGHVRPGASRMAARAAHRGALGLAALADWVADGLCWSAMSWPTWRWGST